MWCWVALCTGSLRATPPISRNLYADLPSDCALVAILDSLADAGVRRLVDQHSARCGEVVKKQDFDGVPPAQIVSKGRVLSGTSPTITPDGQKPGGADTGRLSRDGG